MDGVLAREQRAGQLLRFISKGWSWLFLLVLLTFFSLTGGNFFSFTNLQNMLTNMAFVLLLALGQTFVIILGGLDLSTGYIMGLSSVVSALIIATLGSKFAFPLIVLLGIAGGIAAGCLPGLLNGLIIARFSVPPFIVTLGMLGIAQGTGYILAHGVPVSIPLQGLDRVSSLYLLYLLPDGHFTLLSLPSNMTSYALRHTTGILPLQLVVCVFAVLLCHWLLAYTRFGQHTYAIGGNRRAAVRAGIPLARHTIVIYLLSALLAACAGILFMLRYTSGSTDAGQPMLIDSVAAVAIGGASLFGGEGTMIGTLIGTLIIAVIQSGLIFLNIDPFWQYIAIGVIIIVAVFIDQAKTRVLRQR